MWSFVFVIMIAIRGSASVGIFRQCDDSKCVSLPFEAFTPDRAPDAARLKVICGPTVERFKCQNNVIEKCLGKTLEELATSDNETVATFSRLFKDVQGVVIDICDEESLLHQSYVSIVDCFNTVLVDRPMMERCNKEANAVFDTYLQTQEDPMQDADSECLVTAYTLACITVDLRERCGELARATLMEVFKRTKFLTSGFSDCSDEQVSKLKTKFLDFLDMDEEKRSWFSEAFETRRK